MNYDSWKLATPPEHEADDEPEARADTCPLCGSFEPGMDDDGFCTQCAYAADGGEENDMATEEQMTGEFPWETQLRFLLEKASDLQLKAARYAVETEQKKRLEDAQATIRALDPKAPKPRARRSDAGHPRAPKAANDVPREGGVAV